MAALLLAATVARAQYYSWGADAASLRWRTIRTPDVQVIFPDTAGAIARRTLHFIEAARPSIGYGFRHGPLKIPFVMHPENFRSNGLVMWLPKRVEFLTSPAIDSYSMPWYKQLVAHEYRHAVQYNNLNRGVIKGLSYVLGQQGSTVGLLLLPIWLIEGDAVQMETQMSSFGRALQPSFTMEYRALGDAVRSRRNIDRWFCGSYRTNVPDHYHLGYQIAAYADTRYRENIWDKVAWYGARNPYMIFTTSIALKKFYRTDVGTLFAETFDGLNYYWNALPARRNSSRYLSAEPVESYTTYAFPLAVDAQRVLALKTDYDRPTRFVTIDTESGRERAVAYTGSVSTRPAYADGRVWRRSTGVRRSSSSGSPRSSATWISTAASPKPCAGGAMRSTPRRPTAGWHGSNTRPTGVSPSRARRVCNTGRLRRRPNCTDWRGTTAPRGSTSWPPTIRACGSAASNPTGRPLI